MGHFYLFNVISCRPGEVGSQSPTSRPRASGVAWKRKRGAGPVLTPPRNHTTADGTRLWGSTYVFFYFFSYFWLMFGELWEACSRLYRRQRSTIAFNNSAQFRQTFSHFCNSIFKISLIFSKKLSKIHKFWWKFSGISAIWNFTEKTKTC